LLQNRTILYQLFIYSIFRFAPAVAVLIQTWFQNHRSRTKQSLWRLVNADVRDATSAAAAASTNRRQHTTLSDDMMIKQSARCRRKRTSNDILVTSDRRTTTSTNTTKGSYMAPSGEHDKTNSELPRHLTTFSELQTPLLGCRADTEHDEAASESSPVVKKIRYFTNFYRQPEPGEVFVGGRLIVETRRSAVTNQSINQSIFKVA